MKGIVIYKSSTGFTKRYAEWIAEELGCETITLKEATSHELSGYDTIVYGGGIRANMINGLDKFKKIVDNYKQLYVFGVGASEDSNMVIEEIRKANVAYFGNISFYYFRGGMNLDKMRGLEKMMMRIIKKSLAKKQDLLEKDKAMIEMLSMPCDFSNKNFIEPLISALRVNENCL